jgi:hypothetical protein
MKLREITNITFQNDQINEGLKQKLASIILGILVSMAAQGAQMKDVVDDLPAQDKKELSSKLGLVINDADFQKLVKQKASTNKDPKVKEPVNSQASLKKFGDELKAMVLQ